MSTKRTILILIFYYFIGVNCSSTDDVMRKGKFLGITGFLSGSANGFHLAPFLRQWNALLQVNVEKNRHHGVFVIPASSLYYPSYGGYGLYSPYNLGEIGGGGGGGGLVHPSLLRPALFDDYKASTTTLTPFNADTMDKPKFDLITDNELNDQWDDQSNDGQTGEPDPNVSVFNLNVRDDRKTHKRDIEQKNQTDVEAVVATVVEITEMAAATTPSAATTAAPTSAIGSLVQTTTEIPEMQTVAVPATTTTTAANTSSTPTSPPPPTSTSTTSTTESAQGQSGFQPLLNVYYGGAPNDYANLVYFTTSEPAENLEPPTEKPQMASDRNDHGKFRPSIQYEYRNYRYDTDSHFVPIVGAKQIF